MDNDGDKPALDASFGIQLVKKYRAAKHNKNAIHNRSVAFFIVPLNKVNTPVFLSTIFLFGNALSGSSFSSTNILLAFSNAFLGCLFNKNANDSFNRKRIIGTVSKVAVPAK